MTTPGLSKSTLHAELRKLADTADITLTGHLGDKLFYIEPWRILGVTPCKRVVRGNV